MKDNLYRIEKVLFPASNIFSRQPSFRLQVLIFLVLFLLFTLAGNYVPEEGIFAFDWKLFHSPDWEARVFHPPWFGPFISVLSWPTLIGLSLAGMTMAIWKRAVHPFSAICSFLTLPLFWTLFLGQVDGLITLGLLGIPWLAPLALLKPQVSVFAFTARRSYLIGLLIFLLFSFLLWGFWPYKMIQSTSFYQDQHFQQDIALKLWGLPVALVLFWFSRGDMDMLMIAGCFSTLHLIPYNLLPIVPAIARLRPRAALIAGGCTWLPLSANWFGPGGWWLGWIFILWLWACLAVNRYSLLRPWVRFRQLHLVIER